MRLYGVRLPRNAIVLGWVSLLTDLSSEMIYPLLPSFLTTVIGAGAMALGWIEGTAEATASLLKAVSGAWSDRSGRRKPLVVLGYGLSGASRPLIGVASVWTGVLALRFADRIGKGLRTAPRDALLADSVSPDRLGWAFGFHRAMDHAGAVCGPLAAAALLAAGVPLRGVFLLAVLPAAAVMLLLTQGVHEGQGGAVGFSRSPEGPIGTIPCQFRRLLFALFVFTLGNSADVFLLLRLSDAGITPTGVALLWSAHHGVKLVCNLVGGRLVDRVGRKPILAFGWVWYAAIYLGFALVDSPRFLVVLFLLYGLYFGLAEPAERAWAADLTPRGQRGRAYGLYHGSVGLAALPASLGFGVLWQVVGPEAAFGVGAALAVVATALLGWVPASHRGAAPG